jgi:hypothetical protein
VQREAAGADIRGVTGRGGLPRLEARRIAERKGWAELNTYQTIFLLTNGIGG